LNWPWQTEYIARFVPLISVLSVQLIGGALVAEALTGKRLATAPLWWGLTVILLLPLQYWVVVSQADTDNLTELMANNASFGAFFLLCSYLLLVGCIGTLLANIKLKLNTRRVFMTLAAVVISVPLGYLIVNSGTESLIIKEQKAFSALQFLLSTDRTQYATGFALWARFAVAHLAMVILIAFAQHFLLNGTWQFMGKRLPLLRQIGKQT
jgi:hypothetical protein